MKRLRAVMLIIAAALTTACGDPCLEALGHYHDASEDAFAPREALIKARNTNDGARLQDHAWSLFRAVTAPISRRCQEPVFRTWYGPANVLPHPGVTVPRGALVFQRSTIGDMIAKPDVTASTQGQLSWAIILFNGAAEKHIRQENVINCTKAQRWLSSGQKAIPEFPEHAITIKTKWIWIPGTKPWSARIKGVWKNYPVLPDAPYIEVLHPNHPQYRELVGKRGTGDVAYYADLNEFYRFEVDLDHGVFKEDDVGGTSIGDAQNGDYYVLAGFHITTKEIPDWFWSTYWWTPRSIFSANCADLTDVRECHERVAPTLPKGHSVSHWNNYTSASTVSVNRNHQRAFNPYIEGDRPGGELTNCISCHQFAVAPRQGAERISSFATADELQTFVEPRVRTDFSWTIEGYYFRTGCLAQKPAPAGSLPGRTRSQQ